MKKVIKEEDISGIYDLIWGQFKEDREAIMSTYKELKCLTDTPERYAVNGHNLSKFSELLIKQTGQIIELLKVAHKESEKKECEGLSEDDIHSIANEINKK